MKNKSLPSLDQSEINMISEILLREKEYSRQWVALAVIFEQVENIFFVLIKKAVHFEVAWVEINRSNQSGTISELEKLPIFIRSSLGRKLGTQINNAKSQFD